MAETRNIGIAIVGGGPAALGLACTLANLPLPVVVLTDAPEKTAAPPQDGRSLALSLSSQRILEGCGVWTALAPHAVPIRRIHVSQQGLPGTMLLQAEQIGASALGYTVPAGTLLKALDARLERAPEVRVFRTVSDLQPLLRPDAYRLRFRYGKRERQLEARLLVAADGIDSGLCRRFRIPARTHDYLQTAVIAGVTPERPHGNTAYERFSRDGPLAILPLQGKRCKLVLTVPSGQANAVLSMPDAEFLELAERRFGRRLGHLSEPGARSAWPLRFRMATRQSGERFLVFGQAALALHPNAAQGYNLCLRDAAVLAELVTAHSDPGTPDVLRAYLAARRPDRWRGYLLSEGLARLFYNDRPLLSLARGLGMAVIDVLPSLKRQLLLGASGLLGRQPDLVRGSPWSGP